MSVDVRVLSIHRAYCEREASDGHSAMSLDDYLGYFCQFLDSTSTDSSMFGFTSDSDDYEYLRTFVYRHIHGLEPV